MLALSGDLASTFIRPNYRSRCRPTAMPVLKLPLSNKGLADVAFLVFGVWLLYRLVVLYLSRIKTPKLRGPPAKSWFWGFARETSILEGDSTAAYGAWSDVYGPVFQVPAPLGTRTVVLFDPKAIAHYFSREAFGYVNAGYSKTRIAKLVSFVKRPEES